MNNICKTCLILFLCICVTLLIFFITRDNSKQFKDPFTMRSLPDQPIITTFLSTKHWDSNGIRSNTGLGKDFDVFLSTLYNSSHHKSSNSSHVITQDDNKITLEHIPDNGENYVFIPNQELVSVNDEKELLNPGKVRLVLCKSVYARKIFERFREKHGCTWEVESFVFPPVTYNQFFNFPKSRSVYFHPAGGSRMKNTTTVVKAWAKHPEWPDLIVTCNGDCDSTHAEIRNISSNSNNIVIYGFLDIEDMRRMQSYSGVVIMPSACEGFGHSIYEAMENGNLLITLDIPPVNENMRDGENCLLIKPETEYKIGDPNGNIEWIKNLSPEIGLVGSSCFEVSIEGIEKAVERSFNLSEKEYNNIRLTALQDITNMITTGIKSIRNVLSKSGFTLKQYKDVNNSRPIDVVVTWVNTTDPGWVSSYEYHTGKTLDKGSARWTPVKADPETELSMCLELVRKNMPWVRNTYVVTASPQRPKCLKDEIIVHHHELGLTPVFNSLAIESSLHLIPGLSENFIYLNDDFYVRLPVYPSAFITKDGLPILRFDHFEHSENANAHLNSLQLTAKITNSKPIVPLHTPLSLSQTMMKDVENTYPTEWNETRRCILRHTCESEITPIAAAMNMALRSGKAVKSDDEIKNLFLETLQPIDMTDIHFVCVNSLDGDIDDLRRTLQIE